MEASPGLVFRICSPTLDHFEVSMKLLDLVPDSGELITGKEQINLLQAVEICPLDLQRLFEGVLDGRRKLG